MLFNQVDQQVAAGRPATVLVERSNGDITTAQVMGVAEGSGRTDAYVDNISQGITDETRFKSMGNEKLTDRYQEHLARKLAGIALRGDMPRFEEPTQPYIREPVSSARVQRPKRPQ